MNKAVLMKGTGFVFMVIFFILSIQYFKVETIIAEGQSFFGNGRLIVATSLAYLAAFLLRALAWQWYINKPINYFVCLKGILFSLFMNHVSPLKVGDLIRIQYLHSKQGNVSFDEAVHSVVMMRTMDVFFLLVFSAAGLIFIKQSLHPIYSGLTIGVAGILIILLSMIIKMQFPAFYRKHKNLFLGALTQRRNLLLLPIIGISWMLEGFVLFNVTRSMGMNVSFIQSAWVNALTVGGQVFQVTPGGISTYESVLTASLSMIGQKSNEAYSAAILSHAFKFLFSYVAGILLFIRSPRSVYNQFKSFK